jgi:hypothetical protein
MLNPVRSNSIQMFMNGLRKYVKSSKKDVELVLVEV